MLPGLGVYAPKMRLFWTNFGKLSRPRLSLISDWMPRSGYNHSLSVLQGLQEKHVI